MRFDSNSYSRIPVANTITITIALLQDPETMNKEVELGKSIVDAAVEAQVKHFIFSTLPNAEKISKGKYRVPHFTDKV